jgi:hypothetical protein
VRPYLENNNKKKGPGIYSPAGDEMRENYAMWEFLIFIKFLCCSGQVLRTALITLIIFRFLGLIVFAN